MRLAIRGVRLALALGATVSCARTDVARDRVAPSRTASPRAPSSSGAIARSDESQCERDLECHFFVSRTCEMTAVHEALMRRAPYAGQDCRELGITQCMCAIPAFRPRCVAGRCELDRSFSWVTPARAPTDAARD